MPVDPLGSQLLPDNVATAGGHVSRKRGANGDEAVGDELLHVGIREHPPNRRAERGCGPRLQRPVSSSSVAQECPRVPSTTGATRLTVKSANLGTVKTDEHDALGLTPEQFDLALNVDKALLPN